MKGINWKLLIMVLCVIVLQGCTVIMATNPVEVANKIDKACDDGSIQNIQAKENQLKQMALLFQPLYYLYKGQVATHGHEFDIDIDKLADSITIDCGGAYESELSVDTKEDVEAGGYNDWVAWDGGASSSNKLQGFAYPITYVKFTATVANGRGVILLS